MGLPISAITIVLHNDDNNVRWPIVSSYLHGDCLQITGRDGISYHEDERGVAQIQSVSGRNRRGFIHSHSCHLVCICKSSDQRNNNALALWCERAARVTLPGITNWLIINNWRDVFQCVTSAHPSTCASFNLWIIWWSRTTSRHQPLHSRF